MFIFPSTVPNPQSSAKASAPSVAPILPCPDEKNPFDPDKQFLPGKRKEMANSFKQRLPQVKNVQGNGSF